MMNVMTEKQLCETLKVNRVFIYQCRQNGMPYFKLGKKIIRYNYNDVIEWFSVNFNSSEVISDAI